MTPVLAHSTKGPEYLIAIAFLLVFIFFIMIFKKPQGKGS